MTRMTGASLYDAITLSASSAKTATGNSGNDVLLPTAPGGVFFELDVTAAATDATDLLDVYIQTKLAGSWVDVLHFRQVLGNGGALAFRAKIAAGGQVAEFEDAVTLSEGEIRHLIGSHWRARWVVVDSGNADQSFTFSVKAVCM